MAREIFQQDLPQIYSEQTMRRDTLNRESLSVMREMCGQIQNRVCDSPRVESLMQTFAERLGSFDSPVISNDERVFTDAETPDSEPDFLHGPDVLPAYQEAGMQKE